MSQSTIPLMSYYYIIKVYTKLGGDLVELKRWDNLRFDTRIKYDWYFTYRAALLQVKYPKYLVNCKWGHEPATAKTLEQLKARKVTNLKSRITKYKNRLEDYKQQFEQYKKSYRALFPMVNEDLYKHFVTNIEVAEARILKLETEFQELLKDY